MDFMHESSTTWSYDAQLEEQALLFYPLDHGNELDGHHLADTSPLDIHDAQPAYYPGWNPPSSGSSRGSSSPTSSGLDEPAAVGCAIPRQSFIPFDRSCRSTSGSPPNRFPSCFGPFCPEPGPPIVHETYEVETGEEVVVKALIHRFTEEEKRSLEYSSGSSRPTFCCHVRGCGKWLFHRAQIKPHLLEHGYRFCKPFKCACGADFGRQVEAARHVEDKKLCEQCHRSGRKYKGSAVCLRCLRRPAQIGQ